MAPKRRVSVFKKQNQKKFTRLTLVVVTFLLCDTCATTQVKGDEGAYSCGGKLHFERIYALLTF